MFREIAWFLHPPRVAKPALRHAVTAILIGCAVTPVDDPGAQTGRSNSPVDRVESYRPPRGYVCFRADGASRTDASGRTVTPAITVDGRLDERAWQAAPWTADFVDIEGERKPNPRFRTRAKLLWDDTYFYIAAELDEPHVWGTLTVHDSVIFHDNDFEVFVDPDGDSHNYGEFEINARNTGWDLRLPKPYKDGGRADDGWEIAGLRTAVHVRGTWNDARDIDSGWTIEIAIPWRGLVALFDETTPVRTARRDGSVFLGYEPESPEAASARDAAHAGPRSAIATRVIPLDGEQWRVNFSRVEWLHRVTGEGRYERAPNTREDNWVWSPQGVINMHRPETWGYVQFSMAAADSPKARDVRFRPDPAGPARHLLSRIYYGQIEFRSRNQRFAGSLAELGFSELPHDSLAGPIELQAKSQGFVATAPVKINGKAASWHIRDDARLWRD